MATTYTKDGSGQRVKASIPAGETSDAILLGSKASATAVPGTGGSMYAEATWSLPDDVNAGTATWHTWDAGTVFEKTTQIVETATAVRFTAIGATGVGEVTR